MSEAETGRTWEFDNTTGGYQSDDGEYLLRRDVLAKLNAYEQRIADLEAQLGLVNKYRSKEYREV